MAAVVAAAGPVAKRRRDAGCTVTSRTVRVCLSVCVPGGKPRGRTVRCPRREDNQRSER